ncbi:MAG: CPBP family intramembrane metalloprotease [Planctomycetota bacterium]|nr:MAG: CPBP family intramembrane metalloprotease [Planctomycetota bacterium]
MSGLTLLRMVRLCLKEHRESLRDRRTIVTLVLMPLLVYPLLSLILNRAVLTAFDHDPQSAVTFGIAAELHDTELASMLALGWSLTKTPEAPVRVLEKVYHDGRPSNADEPPIIGDGPSSPQLVLLDDDGRSALRNGSVDLVILHKVSEDEEEASAFGGSNPSMRRRLLSQLIENYLGGMGGAVDVDVDAILEVLGTYEVQYREGDQQSLRALQTLERIMAALNNEAAAALMGPGYTPPVRLAVRPVVLKSSYSDVLATMVPLVLVLMTMAGAVYPAIDLTAGERERGTMESLIVSPTPTAFILLAKYSAVVTVALLTALANLAAMSVTLWVSGIGGMIFGEDVLSREMIGTILALLVLFTMFFAALLLAVTSFAKSFKEAQAYLIPLMLLAMTPGVMSLLPGIRFTPLLATVPLVNIVLLARELLTGEVEVNAAIAAVLCTCVYALAALAVASRLFGSNASLYGSQGSWADLLIRPAERRERPGVDQMALTMAVMFPMYFIASNLLPFWGDSLTSRLWASAAVSILLLVGLPLLVCWYRRIDVVTTFLLPPRPGLHWAGWLVGIVLAAGSMWMFAHEIVVWAKMLGLYSLTQGQLEQAAEFRQELAQVPLVVILLTLAVAPAFCEELLFRGFVMSSLHKSAWGAVILSAIGFGLMHVLTSNILAVERFLPTTFIGLVLGFIAWRTRTIWPGVLLHVLHNGFLLLVTRYQEEIAAWGILVEEGEHLPGKWLVAGGISLVASLVWMWLLTRGDSRPRSSLPEI